MTFAAPGRRTRGAAALANRPDETVRVERANHLAAKDLCQRRAAAAARVDAANAKLAAIKPDQILAELEAAKRELAAIESLQELAGSDDSEEPARRRK
jgi:hypothetical protein